MNLRRIFILITCLAFSHSSAQANWIQESQEMNLSQDPVWHALLHYEKDIFWRYRSSIDDPSFFIAPRGHTDPQAELEATLVAFTQPDAPWLEDQPPACRYPARYAWLDQKLGLSAVHAPPPCSRFDEWKKKLAPQSVSMVFSSYYLNNPASMYGHTFLKLARTGYETSSGLLDYTINYEAIVNTNNGIMFAVRGLTGGYRGRFSTLPYYMKVQQYNNVESRDLWEYELSLKQTEIDQMIRHLWELGPASIRYFFFNKNCSYQLMPLLQVARPHLKLAQQFKFRAIPLDTIRAVLNEPGLVQDIHYRPSHMRKMFFRRSQLSPAEIKLVENIIDPSLPEAFSPLASLPQERQASILDSAHDLLRHQHGFERVQSETFKNLERKILLERKKIDASTAAIHVPPLIRPPHEGHGSRLTGFAFGDSKETTFEEITLRAALHDLEADPTGFIPGSQLEMFHLKVRYENDRKKLNLEQLKFLDIFSLAPYDRWVHPPSWHVKSGFQVARDLNEDAEDSLEYNLSGGSGYTWGLSHDMRNLIYIMWLADTGVGHAFDKGYRYGLGGLSGLIWQWGRFRSHISAAVLRYPSGHINNVVRLKGIATLSLSQNSELRMTLKRAEEYKEALLSLNLYH